MKCPNCGKEMAFYCYEDLKHLFSKIDFGKSFLDADAVKILNGEKGVICSNLKSEKSIKKMVVTFKKN